MSLPRKIAYNVIISSAAKISSTVAALVGIGFITRYLGQAGFGMYATTLAFFSLFSALGDWGLYQTSTREISKPDADEKKIMESVFGLRIVISLGLFVITPLFIIFLNYPTQLKVAIVIVALANAFSLFYQILIGMFQRRLMMDRVTISEFIGKVIQVATIIIGIKLDLGFYFIISTLLINMIINFSIVFWLSRKFITIKPKFDMKIWKEFLTQSMPIGISAVITFIYFKADTILLSFFRTPEEVGLYGAAYKVIENVSFFPSMIIGLVMPMLSYHLHTDQKKFQDLVNKNFKVFLILVIPLLIGTWFLANGIVDIIAGPEFAPSATILRIIIFALGFIFFGNLFNNILIVAKLQKKLLNVLIICAVFNITANLIFIPKYSYFATASTSVATEFLVILFSGILIYRNLHFLPKTDKFHFMILSGFFMAAYLWFFQGKSFFLLLLTSPIIYFASLVIFNVISKEEIKSLISKKPEIEQAG